MKMPVKFMLGCAVAVLLWSAAAVAATTGTLESQENWELLGPLVIERLDNGMTFLIYPNNRAPIFSGLIRFDVGGKNEVPGQTGIAHMFEHMAFKGTRRIGTRDAQAEGVALEAVEKAAQAFDRKREEAAAKGLGEDEPTQQALTALAEQFEQAKQAAAQYVVKDEFDQIYSREGATDMNATTSQDATTYFISLPSNRLELWMKMESERLMMPVMREFYSERDVVLEERRMRQDNSPVGQLWEQTMATAYMAHPYGYPTIGWEQDIRNLKASGAYAFFRDNYTPDRAVGVLVGDLDVERTRAMLRETFGQIPAARPDAPYHHILAEPAQKGERRITLNLQATPTLLMGWHKPCAPAGEDLCSEMLMEILTGGRSGVWFEKFVKQERLAADVSVFTGPGEMQPNMFMVYATPQGEATLEQLEQALRAEIDRLGKELVDDATLAAARKRRRAAFIRTLEDNLGLARALAEYTMVGQGDPYYLERRLWQLEQVSAEDIRAFVQTYLTPQNLTVGWLEPAGEAQDSPAATH